MTDDAQAQRRRRRRRLFGVAAITLGLLIALGVGEIAVRIGDVTSEPRRHFSPGIYAADPTLGWVLLPNYTGVHKEYTFEAPTTTNAQGFRGPAWSAERTQRPVRILALGDSCTFGRGVDDASTWPALLEAKLNLAGPTAAIFNAGVPGYDTRQELEVLRRLGPTVKPTHVILAWLPNDVIERSVDAVQKIQVLDQHLVQDVEKYRAWRKRIDHRGLHGSELYRFFRVKSKQLQSSLGFGGRRYEPLELDPKALAYSQDDILKIKALTDGLGAKLLLVLFPRQEALAPDANQSHHDLMAAFAKQHAIPVVNLAQLWKGKPREGRFLPRDAVHPTPSGYAEVADAIAPALAR